MQMNEKRYEAAKNSRGGTILLVTEVGNDSQEALDFASELAEKNDAQLHLLHVINPEQAPSTPDGQMGMQYRLEILARSLRNLKKRAKATRLFGIPERVIPKRAADTKAGLVLVASNGSESDRVRKRLVKHLIQKCECPVVVLPPRIRRADARSFLRLWAAWSFPRLGVPGKVVYVR
jgi:nucleotide-binding universal stress UspA family protein